MNLNDIEKTQELLTNLRIHHWAYRELFSFQWWIEVGLLIIPWIVWWNLVDKKQIGKIFSFGLLMLIFTSLLDNVGIDLVLWGYSYLIIPVIVRLLAANFGVLPVAYMLIYQYCPSWKRFILANILLSAAFSFIAEPIFVWLDIYKMYKWEYVYSFPIYIFLGIFFRFLVEIVFKDFSIIERISLSSTLSRKYL